MAYSENPITVERMLPYLEPLEEGGEVRWRAPGKARWLAYRIREALAIAREHQQRFPSIAEMAEHYRIEVHGKDEVHARLKPRVEVETEPLTLRAWAPRPYVGMAEAIVEDISSSEVLMKEWAREGRTAGKLYFPNTDLGPDGLMVLWEWAQNEGVLIFENLGAITLLPKEGNEDAAEFAWDPSELDTENPISPYE